MIGEVTDGGRLRAFHDGELVGDIPVAALTDGCPRYESTRSARPACGRRPPLPRPRRSPTPTAALRALLASPNIASRRWVTRQYDQLVGSGTVVRPGRRRGGRAADAVASGRSPSRSTATAGAPRSTRAAAGMSAVCEAARNVACTGARPAAVTNCLNFGNPETAEVGYELAEAIEGMAAGLRGARPAGRLGQRLALQRAPRAARSTPRRWSAWSACSTTPRWPSAPASARTGDVVLLAGDGPARARRLGVPEAGAGRRGRGASPSPTSRPSARLHELPGRGRRAPACCEARTTCPTAASPSRSPSRPSSAAIGVDAAEPRDDLFGEGDGRVVISVAPGTLAALRASWPASCRCAGSARSAATRIAWPAPRDRPGRGDAARYEAAIPRDDSAARDRLMCGVFGIYDPPARPTATSPG